MADTSERRAVSITQTSYISIGLVLALVAGATVFGRQMQRLDAIEASQQQIRQEVTMELRELRTEVRDLRSTVVRSTTAGR